ncbi:MAG: hypothetical protein Q8L23_15765 [Caulobacter sp.]|nr:hypothetical protein [Caulobacter sp.]
MTAAAYRPGQALRVVDAAGYSLAGKAKRPPFTDGEIVTVATAFPGRVILRGKDGMWRAARFVPHSDQG